MKKLIVIVALSTLLWNATCYNKPYPNRAKYTVEQQYYKGVLNSQNRVDPSQQSYSPVNTIYFDFNSYNLSLEAQQKLQNLYLQVLVNEPQTQFFIEGNTDTSGSVEYNFLLSRKRAETTLEFLTSLGATPANFIILPKGELSPIADNNLYPELNRRVIIYRKNSTN